MVQVVELNNILAGKSDPYCIVIVGKQKKKTKVIKAGLQYSMNVLSLSARKT